MHQKGAKTSASSLKTSRTRSCLVSRARRFAGLIRVADCWEIHNLCRIEQAEKGPSPSLLEYEDARGGGRAGLILGITHWQHGRFFAYFPAISTFESMLAELYSASVCNPGFNVSSVALTTPLPPLTDPLLAIALPLTWAERQVLIASYDRYALRLGAHHSGSARPHVQSSSK